MESILTSIKKLLGLTEEYKHFDTDIIMHINTALFDLAQLGVGPTEGFSISGDEETWSDFVPDLVQNSVKIEAVKTYIYISVKLVFDPPINSSVVSSLENRLKKLEWLLNAAVDPIKES